MAQIKRWISSRGCSWGNQIRKEEVKLSLIANDMISVQKILRDHKNKKRKKKIKADEFGKVAGYNINI